MDLTQELTGIKNIIYIKQSRYRPGVAQRVPVSCFPDFTTTAQDGGKIVSFSTGRLYPQEIHLALISVRG